MVHAYNNCAIDYGLLALCCCLLIKKHLSVNKTVLITCEDTLDWLQKTQSHDLIDYAFDYIKVTDRNWYLPTRQFYDTIHAVHSVEYDNESRFKSYWLSPFEETILVDADFLILDKSIDAIWGCDEDLLINKLVTNLNFTQKNIDELNKNYNEVGIPRYWSSIMYFKKTPRSQFLFHLASFIKMNWKEFWQFHKQDLNTYISFDQALSVAVHLMNSQIDVDSIKPFSLQPLLVSTELDHFVDFKKASGLFLRENSDNQWTIHKISTNVHVMNKWAMLRMSDRIIKYATEG